MSDDPNVELLIDSQGGYGSALLAYTYRSEGRSSRLTGTLTAHEGQTLNRWLSAAANRRESTAVRSSSGAVLPVPLVGKPDYMTGACTQVEFEGRDSDPPTI